MSQPAFDFDDAALDDGGEPTYSVCELAEAINDQIRRGFRDGVWVRGEINGLQHRGPHTYFSLVEDASEKTVLTGKGARHFPADQPELMSRDVNFNGTDVARCDFSGFNMPGR